MPGSKVVEANDERARRWESEAAHTDEWVRQTGRIQPIPSDTWKRYSSPPFRRHVSRELAFSLIGGLQGKRVLDVGCGEGMDSALLARLGARVTGIDVSPVAIERANERARVNGVAGNTRFVCSPLETADIPSEHFDLIWCWAFLHHVVDDFRPIVERIVQWGKPGGAFLFHEPVNQAQWLHRLRRITPVGLDATPDERPLERRELDVLRELLPDLVLYNFRLVGRVDRFIIPPIEVNDDGHVSGGYEFSSWPRRRLFDAVNLADHWLLKLPGVSRLCATAVGWGHVQG